MVFARYFQILKVPVIAAIGPKREIRAFRPRETGREKNRAWPPDGWTSITIRLCLVLE